MATTKICRQTGKSFEVSQQELDILDQCSPIIAGKKYTIPSSQYHPDVAHQWHLAWRNERNLYRSVDCFTGKSLITCINPDLGYKVCTSLQRYQALQDPIYGQKFDFSQSFTENFDCMFRVMPQFALHVSPSMENCDYCNYGMESKNCYMAQTPIWSEQCYYSCTPLRCYYDIDGFLNTDCQYTYQCVYAMNCYKCQYTAYSSDCKNSHFLLDCKNCEYCYRCVNLVNKKYCIDNIQYSKEEYQTRLQELIVLGMEKNLQEFYDFTLILPRRAVRGNNNQDSRGDLNFNTKHTVDSYDLQDIDTAINCRTCGVLSGDFARCTIVGVSKRIYNSIGVAYGESCAFNIGDNNCYQCYYTYNCRNCEYCFGCVGLQYKKYHILNTSYTKEEYEIILPKILEHMTETGERGEFFNPSLAPYLYNDTNAFERFPEKKEDILTRGWKRIDHEYATQDNVGYTPQEISYYAPGTEEYTALLSSAIVCSQSKRPFKIIQQELDFYYKMNIQIPSYHPDERYRWRFRQYVLPRKLFERTCAKTGVDIFTPYSPERPEIVRSEEIRDKEFRG